MTSTEERLSRTLHEVAASTSSRPDWDRVVGDAGRPLTGGSTRARAPWPKLLVAAAAAVALVAGGVALGRFGSGDSPIEAAGDSPIEVAGFDYVLPGETVIGTDPLVVMAAPAPAAEFDTSQLGTELTFEPIDQPEDVVDLADNALLVRGPESPEPSVTKITAVGRVDGIPWIVAIIDAPPEDGLEGRAGETLRVRQVMSPLGGSGSGDLVPVDSLELIAPRSDVGRNEVSGPDYDIPEVSGPDYDSPEGWLSWDTELADVAVVSFADDDERMWIRPRAGVAVFPVQFDEGEGFTLEALDSTGQVIARYVDDVVVEDAIDLSVPQIGDQFLTIRGTDERGQSVVIRGDGRPTVLVFGASWCAPCGELDEVIEILGRLNPTVRVLAGPLEEPGEGTWPAADWPFGVWIPGTGEPFNSLDALPTVVVLDGTNTIAVMQVGFEGLEGSLAAAGLDLVEPAPLPED